MKVKLTLAVLATAVALPLMSGAKASATSTPTNNVVNNPQALSCGSNHIDFDFAYGFPDRYNHQPNVTLAFATINVPANLQGNSADVTASVVNLNGSVHPNSDIILQSGSSTLTLPDTESAATKTTNGSGTFNLGSTFVLSAHLGADGVMSAKGDVDINVNCPTPSTPSTPVVLGETTQVVAPVGAVKTGFGGESSTTDAVAVAGVIASTAVVAYGVRRLARQ